MKNKTKGIYKFHADCGRQGCLDGVFIEEKRMVEKLLKSGIEIEFGEVLGKHSDITWTVEDSDITFVTDNLASIELIESLDLEHGFNPFDYYISSYSNEYECDNVRELIEKMLENEE